MSHLQRSIELTKVLVEAARSRRISIIWTRYGFRDAAEAGLFLEMRPTLSEGGLRTGIWGYEIMDGLDARPRRAHGDICRGTDQSVHGRYQQGRLLPRPETHRSRRGDKDYHAAPVRTGYRNDRGWLG